ncbi:MAG: cytochrome-c peroxidase, partial [Bryobacterales bacterium]|nr:cytochrome-c peroxidase [Bryobacterales bacterium]
MISRRLLRLPAFAAMVALAASSLAAGDVAVLEAIGWKLFFDPMLSAPRNTSCATCHIPENGFESGVALGEGAYGDRLPRNAPTVVNLADAKSFFWDGRAESLEEQSKGPIENPIEMDLSLAEAAQRVRDEPA